MPTCQRCGTLFVKNHICKSRWLCSLFADEWMGATPIYAFRALDAAELFSEQYDKKDIEYPPSREVFVRRAEEDTVPGTIQHYRVICQAIPSYTAHPQTSVPRLHEVPHAG